MQMVRFEAYRDLVKLLQLGVAEEAGILLAEDENLDARAAAKSSAAAQAAGPKQQAPGALAGAHACMPRPAHGRSACHRTRPCLSAQPACSSPCKGCPSGTEWKRRRIKSRAGLGPSPCVRLSVGERCRKGYAQADRGAHT